MSNLSQINQQLADKVSTELLNAIQTDPTCTAPVFPTVAGKSAYDIAVEHGFVGSETTWLNSLKVKGDKGDPGAQGTAGPSGSVDFILLTNWFYPVGIIIDFGIAGFDPNTKYTGTTWVRHGEGQASVGLSTQMTDPGWTRTVGSTFGSYTHQLTVEEMPKHDHEFPSQQQDNYSSSAVTNTNDVGNKFKTSMAGGDKPHNNVQPSIVDARWRRTA